MAQNNQDFNFSNMDWDTYTKHRPPYLPQLYALIFEHHKANGGKWDRALDLGAGNAVVTRELLTKFAHTIYSDVSPDYVAQAEARFASQYPASRLSYLVTSWDDLESTLPDKVDIITAATALHWVTDSDRAMSQIAASLNPGGTFAGFTYSINGLFPPSQPGYAIWEGLMRKFAESYTQQVETGAFPRWSSRYDFLPFDPAVWKDVTRITSLTDREVVPGVPAAPSRAREDVEKRVVKPDDYWTFDVDYDWIRGMLANAYPSLDILTIVKEDFEALEKAMDGKSVMLTYALIMVLATRR